MISVLRAGSLALSFMLAPSTVEAALQPDALEGKLNDSRPVILELQTGDPSALQLEQRPLRFRLRDDGPLFTLPTEPEGDLCRPVAFVLGGVGGMLIGGWIGAATERALYEGEDAGLTGFVVGGLLGFIGGSQIAKRQCD